ARFASRPLAGFPPQPRRRHHLSGRRYRRRLGAAVELVLAAIAQRLRAEDAAQGAQGRQDHLRARQPRRIPAQVLRHAFRRHRRGGEHDPHRRRWQALPHHPRRYLRSRGAERAMARPSRRQGLRLRDPDEPLRQLLPSHVRRALLVA
ncbi:hypothetical protein KXV85_006254, partial [Aspergillus fumigatus]